MAAPIVGTRGGLPFAPAGSWLLVKAASPSVVKTAAYNILECMPHAAGFSSRCDCQAVDQYLRQLLLKEPICWVTAKDVPASRFACSKSDCLVQRATERQHLQLLRT